MEVSDERGAGVVYKIANSSVVKKIKGIKNIRLIAAIFIIAVALLIYSTVAAADSVGTASQTEQSASMDDEESRLAAILGGLDGVGEVEVMMTRRDDEIVGVLVLAEGAEDEPTAEYAQYVIGLLGDEWDADANDWARTDGTYYATLSGYEISNDAATYAAASAAYSVASSVYEEAYNQVSEELFAYTDALLSKATIQIGSLAE